ncbi:hypothetical protein BaRGS_00016620 [Batillaria attramentaria]|uniref:Ig-like domain-containing protein n=1 Tax=Batillaria attramentaria TaxID=370345 RepID=A0ABD0KY13_9CAEN
MTGVLSSFTGHQYPVAKCIWRSDDKDLISISMLEGKSEETIASLDINSKTCVTSANGQSLIGCQVLSATVELYAIIGNITVGKTRTYICRRTYFEDRIVFRDETLNVTTQKENKTPVALYILSAVVAVFAAATPAVSIVFIRFRRRNRRPQRNQAIAALPRVVESFDSWRTAPENLEEVPTTAATEPYTVFDDDDIVADDTGVEMPVPETRPESL